MGCIGYAPFFFFPVSRIYCRSRSSRDMHAKIRTAVFGSLYGGFHLLNYLNSEELKPLIHVVGVATDDPRKAFTHPEVRLWRFAHSWNEEFLVRDAAADLGLPVYTGSVQDLRFQHIFQSDWNPELCLMATFGQKIPKRMHRYPRIGFYNFHHSDTNWPSYPGPNPIEEMIRDGKSHLVLTMHEVSDAIDGGRFVARSKQIRIPDRVNAIQMHQLTWSQSKAFILGQVRKIAKKFKGPLPVIPLIFEREVVSKYRNTESRISGSVAS